MEQVRALFLMLLPNFLLYGKAFRKINKNQLINTTNEKNCLVVIEFNTNGIDWKVERGIKPNIFKIYRNGEELNQSYSAAEQQKWLEQTVLKMNYKSFTQIVILGSSTFVPFMQLPVSSRREVVEDLLDIKIFSSMNVIIKEKIRNIRDEVKTLDLKKISLKDKVDMQKNFIDEISSQSKKTINQKVQTIAELDDEIEKFTKKNAYLQEEASAQSDSMQHFVGAREKLKEYGNIKGKLSQKIQNIVKEHKFFNENRVCPTCDQHIEEEFRLNRIEDSQNKAQDLQKGFEQLQQAIKEEEDRESQFNDLSQVVSKLLNDINQNNALISGHHQQIRRLESEIQTITSQIENRNTEHEKLEQFRDNLQSTYEELAKRKESISYYDFTYSLLKDSGVKAKIIQKYLPLINQQVNKYLQMMEFFINFKLDEEFNETIETPIHEDFIFTHPFQKVRK